MAHPWHALGIRDAAQRLEADTERGLAPGEARRRLTQIGSNQVASGGDRPLWRLALRQFRSLVVLLLLSAAAVAAALGERVEAAAILVAILLNAAIGFGTEWRARRSLARLRALGTPEAIVWRDGGPLRVRATDVVPGDLIVLEAGANVPADGRLIRSSALRTNESTLTGESAPVDKTAEAHLPVDTALADRVTMVYLGTTAVAGSGRAIVIATGSATELGRIGQAVAEAGDRETPLERQIEGLGRRLVVVALAICGVVAAVGILHGEPLGLMLETAISLAVAAIPEGLPAVTAMALAAGVWRLARSHALVRRLSAVETLGSTTVICADKTGTMTENRMTVVRLVLGDRVVDVSHDGAAARMLRMAALVNDAGIERGADGVRLIGDPTETALLEAAQAAGIDVEATRREWPRRREQPFAPETRMMATWHDVPAGGGALLVKGAPDAILARCQSIEENGTPTALTGERRDAALAMNRALAADGLRVLAFAWRPETPDGDTVDGLTFLGFAGLQDPVRPGVKEALGRCREAGLRTIMLTGDQRPTAEAIGRDLGLRPEEIRSRVSPDEKLALVDELQRQGEIVAMTGDGINDAPALARADIGIAMGRRGTDVARDAADIVLTDDDFSTIVRAIEEGRVIYANLRKVIHFLFTCNLSEILTIFGAILLGFPTPLLPLQILWVNIVTDILPAIALIRDPAEPGVMRRPPREPGAPMVTWRFGGRMVREALLLSLGVLGAYLFTVWRAGVGPQANTVALLALVLMHPFQAMNCRSEGTRWWRLPRNDLMWVALLALALVQWAALSWPPLGGLLRTIPLSAVDWLVAVVAALWPVALLEASKRPSTARN